MGSAVEFRILGPLEVCRDGVPVPIRSGRQRALLALLLLRANEPVSVDELTEQLWPDQAPPTARASLHNHVSRLRKLLGGDVLETTATGYAVRVAPEQLDLLRVERLLEEARAADPQTRAALLRDALGGWRGMPLVDFPVEPFAQAEIVRLEELRLLALEERIDADLELGRHAELVPELEGLVALHPLHERLWRQLMLALYGAGRQAEALATYRRAHRALVDDLGIEPGPALKQLQRAILIQDPALAGRGAAPDDLYRRAVAELPVGERERARALVEYAHALWRLGERERADAALEEASRRARAANDEALEQRALLQRSLGSMLTDATSLLDHARQARKAARVFERVGDLDALADALMQESYMLRDAGRAAAAAELAERAADAARRAGNDDIRRRAGGYLAVALAVGPTPVPAALERCPPDDETATYGVLCARGLLLVEAGEVDAGLELLERGADLARSRGLAGPLSGALHWAAFAYADLGDTAREAAALETAFELVDALDETSSAALSAARLARAAALLGRHEEAERLASSAAAAAARDDLSAEVFVRRARALVLAARGEQAAARTEALEAAALAARSDWLSLRGAAYEDVAAVAPDLAGDALRRALRAYVRKGNVTAARRLTAARATLRS